MIVLDTNVVSELMRPAPDARVVAWVNAQTATELFMTSVGQAEILYGIALVPRGKRRDALARAARGLFEEEFENRILPFASGAAEHFSEIAAARRRAGRPISTQDAQIAAIVRQLDGALATRNVDDFDGCAIDVINPWTRP